MQADVILSFCCDVQKAVIHFFRQDETSPGGRVLIKLTASPKSIILFISFSKKAPRRASYFYLSRLKHGLPGPPGRMAHKEDPFHGRHQAPHCKQPWHVRPAERHRNAGHRLCPHGRALPPRHQRRHPFRVRAVRLPRSVDGRLFIASGYGFRKRSIHKCIEQQLKTLLKPYVYTALATTVLHAFIHHAAFGSWDAAISESAKVLGGFLLGLPHTATYFGQQFSPADPCGT